MIVRWSKKCIYIYTFTSHEERRILKSYAFTCQTHCSFLFWISLITNSHTQSLCSAECNERILNYGLAEFPMRNPLLPLIEFQNSSRPSRSANGLIIEFFSNASFCACVSFKLIKFCDETQSIWTLKLSLDPMVHNVTPDPRIIGILSNVNKLFPEENFALGEKMWTTTGETFSETLNSWIHEPRGCLKSEFRKPEFPPPPRNGAHEFTTQTPPNLPGPFDLDHPTPNKNCPI